MRRIIVAMLILGATAGAQDYPVRYPTKKKSQVRIPAKPPDPSRVLPVGTVYGDKHGEQWEVTRPGQRRNVTNRPKDPATGRFYKQGQRVNATKIGTGYPGLP